MLRKINIVPRWIIFTIDLVCSIAAYFLALVLRHNFRINEINPLDLYQGTLLVLLLNCLVFGALKMYAGIVRYTSAQDAFRIVVAISTSVILLLAGVTYIDRVSDRVLIAPVTLIIYALFAFLFLFSYRIFVKLFFLYIRNASLRKIRVLVYGAGYAGMAVKRALDLDRRHHKQVVAFLDDDPRRVGKVLSGARIIAASALECLLKKQRVDELIFASYTLPPLRKAEVAAICEKHSIQLRNIPAHEVLFSGKVSPAQIRKLDPSDLQQNASPDPYAAGIWEEIAACTILVTGAAGTLGRALVRQLLLHEPALLIICDQDETALHDLSLSLQDERQTFVRAMVGSVRDKQRMEAIMAAFKPRVLFHLAGYTNVSLMEDHPAEALKTNVGGTGVMVDLALRHEVQKMIMVSTDSAAVPICMVAASKRIAEMAVTAAGFTSCRLRDAKAAAAAQALLLAMHSTPPSLPSAPEARLFLHTKITTLLEAASNNDLEALFSLTEDLLPGFSAQKKQKSAQKVAMGS